jgi:hypothetical protein
VTTAGAKAAHGNWAARCCCQSRRRPKPRRASWKTPRPIPNATAYICWRGPARPSPSRAAIRAALADQGHESRAAASTPAAGDVRPQPRSQATAVGSPRPASLGPAVCATGPAALSSRRGWSSSRVWTAGPSPPTCLPAARGRHHRRPARLGLLRRGRSRRHQGVCRSGAGGPAPVPVHRCRRGRRGARGPQGLHPRADAAD